MAVIKKKRKDMRGIKRGGLPRKWNWELAKSLYVSGMKKSDILKLPEFEGLSLAYFGKIQSEQKWAQEKHAAVAASKHVAGSNIQDMITNTIEDHYRFMLKEISDERAIIANRVKTTDLPSQGKRLDMLDHLETIARRTLNLDDMKPGDQNANSFNFLISVHSAPSIDSHSMMSIGIKQEAFLAPINITPTTILEGSRNQKAA